MKSVSLSEVADLTFGYPFPSATYKNSESGMRLLRGDNIGTGRIRWEGVMLWPESARFDESYLVRDGDIVLAMDRPVLSSGLKYGVASAHDSSLLVQRVCRIRAGEGVDPRYLGAVIGSNDFRKYIESVITGSAVPHISGGDISRFSWSLPPLSKQAAIGEVLGALDDKIAANRRVIDAGNSLLRVLYSSTPKISQGLTFADVADVGGGGTPNTKNPALWDGGVGWATPTDVTAADGPWLAHTTRSISEEGLRNCSSPLYPEGSILMTSRATIGAVVVARNPVAVNQGFIVLNAVDPEMQWWLESQVRARKPEFETWANGATFLEISRGTFKKLPVLECSPECLDRFNRTAQAVRERQSACQAENDKLARTRDELLPLLMNGRITVRDGERAVEGVV